MKNIRRAHSGDAAEIASIYNYYVKNTTITFEENPIDDNHMKTRMNDNAQLPWYVYEQNNQILGYAFASKYKVRSAYKHSVKVSVYVRNGNQGKGIGSALLCTLLESLKNSKIHAVVAGIALPNDASIALHEKFGFEKVAHFKEVGYKFDRWIDVGYWQKIITY
jgi:phosphinothricin acetyltransferase